MCFNCVWSYSSLLVVEYPISNKEPAYYEELESHHGSVDELMPEQLGSSRHENEEPLAYEEPLVGPLGATCDSVPGYDSTVHCRTKAAASKERNHNHNVLVSYEVRPCCQ